MPLEWGIIMKNIFDSAYPFTTECISGYFDKLDLANKEVLTVGSSLDQAFNALLCGAGKVTVMDICSYTDDFLKLKKDIIINNPRKKAFKKILKIKSIPFSKDIFSYRDIVRINPYFENDENYELMQDLLKEKEIEVIEGDIFKMDEAIPKRKFDRIIFLNATPFESKLDIFYSQLHILDPSYLPAKTHFQKQYVVYDYRGMYPRPTGKYKNAEDFRRKVGYRYFARTREEKGAVMEDCTGRVIVSPLSSI